MSHKNYIKFFLAIFCVIAVFGVPQSASAYIGESLLNRIVINPLSKVWRPWFDTKTDNTPIYISPKYDKYNVSGSIEDFGLTAVPTDQGSGLSKKDLKKILELFEEILTLSSIQTYSRADQTAGAYQPIINNYTISGERSASSQGLADTVGRSVTSLQSSIDTINANSVFNTGVLSIDTTNTRVGIGTTSPTDTLSVNGPLYLAQISAPSNTTNRLYNTGGDLYWAGNLIGGATTGQWTTDGTHAWRASGNVGIATTSPYRKLSVVGDAVFTGGDVLTSTLTATSSITTPSLTLSSAAVNSLLSTNSSGIVVATSVPTFGHFNATSTTATSTISGGLAIVTSGFVYDYSTGNIGMGTASPGSRLVVKGVGATSASSALNVTNSADTSLLYVRNDGNVGIGTTGPEVKLEVFDATNPSIQVTEDASNTAQLRWISSGNYFKFATKEANTWYDNTLVLKSGNVGIGTTSPSQLLTVGNNNQFTVTSAGNVSGTEFNAGSNGLYTNSNTSIGYKFQGGNSLSLSSYDDYTFNQYNGSSYVPVMTILGTQSATTGNVGIGTTGPGAQLQVNVGASGTMGLIVQGASGQTSDLLSVQAFGGTPLFTVASNGALVVNGGITHTGTLNNNGAVWGNGLVVGSGYRNVYNAPTDGAIIQGNVGIGTTGPGAKLQVAAANAITDTVGYGNLNVYATNAQAQDIGGSITLGGYNDDGASALRVFGTIEGRKSSGTSGQSSGYLSFKTNNLGTLAERVRIDTNGNVGIGTTGPTSKLQVVGVVTVAAGTAAAPTLTFATDSTSGLYQDTGGVVRVSVGGSRVASFVSTGLQLLGGTTVATGPSLSIDSAGTTGLFNPAAGTIGFSSAGTESMRITSTGNVGIGTTTPGSPLDVYGSGGIRISEGAGGNPGLHFWAGGTNVGYLQYVNSGSYLRLVDNGNVGLVQKSGNVGIGTTSPGQKLSVNGSVGLPALANDSTGYYACVNTTTGVLATSTTACGASSLKFKENVLDLGYGLDEILKLRAVSFDYKDAYIKDGKRQIGFVAEEVDLVIPELVAKDASGEIQGLDYPKFTSVLVRALQEMWLKIKPITAWFTSDGKLQVQNDICVDDTCVTKDQFKNLLLQAGVGATQTIEGVVPPPDQGGGAAGGGGESDTATSTEEIIEDTATSTEPTAQEVQTDVIEPPSPSQGEGAGDEVEPENSDTNVDASQI